MNAKTQTAATSESFVLDDRIRGVPPGTANLPIADVARQNWRPAEGAMSLPVLTLDEAAFAHNRELMLRYVSEQGVDIAPHAKTPMSPDLTASLIEAGAWGATVADIRQAAVLLRAGVNRLILANEVGGRGGASRLAALLKAWPNSELYAFVDSAGRRSRLCRRLARRGSFGAFARSHRIGRRTRGRTRHGGGAGDHRGGCAGGQAALPGGRRRL